MKRKIRVTYKVYTLLTRKQKLQNDVIFHLKLKPWKLNISEQVKFGRTLISSEIVGKEGVEYCLGTEESKQSTT